MLESVDQKSLVKTPKKQNIKNIELRKPSELCQVLFYSDFHKEEYALLTPLQIDLISVMFYFVSDIMTKQDLNEEDIYEWASMNHFEINLQSIAEVLGKYDNGFYEPIVSNLQELSKIQVLTNTLHKNKTQESTLFHFIRKITWLKEKHTTSKRVKVWFEPELLIMFLNIKSYFTKFYLQIQFGLKSKYSKLLYDLLKDYSGLGEVTLDFEILKAILNVDVREGSNMDGWSIFNRDIMKRAVKEVNEKSDIKLTYEPIKDRLDKKLEVVKVKFKITKQKSILIDYDEPSTSFDIDTNVVSDDSDRTEDPIEMKLMEIAKKRMNDYIKFSGEKVTNKTNYIKTVLENLKKENLDVASILELETILDEIKDEFRNLKSSKHQLLVMENFENYPVVSISSNYFIYSPVDKSNISDSVRDTINKINNFKKMNGKFKIITTSEKISELEISYL